MRLFGNLHIDRNLKTLVRSALLLGSLAFATGCETRGWLDPGELGPGKNFSREPLARQIVDNIDPLLEEPNQDFARAVEPTAADVQVTPTDYSINPNDQLSISISDLQGPGVETIKTTRVSESGKIGLPYIGPIQAEGLNEIDLEQTIVEAYRNAGLVTRAQVSVSVTEARGRAFTIMGQVARTGQYQIVQSDFRLLDALTAAGDVSSPLLDTVYIIRRTDRGKRSTTAPTTASTGPAIAPPATGPDELAPRGDAGRSGRGPMSLVAAPADDLAPSTRRGAMDSGEVPADDTGRITTIDGKEMTVDPDEKPATDAPPARRPEPSGARPSGEGFEFNDLPDPTNIRVLKIPLLKLRDNGDLKYNIPIQPRDTIIVPALTQGEYYMGGHVTNPGAYSLTARKITLKQAVISARMLDGLAIPQRTEIIRRVGPNKEIFVRVDLDKIFAGTQPDLYLKPYDQVMVGTNAMAPFLAAARGAFRLTYGFGFLYDRNFAPVRGGNGP